ncbi:MAG: hypothetical protein LBL17_02905 [Coxiellaceae bacterium]|nr:hypothetical protein [Coxiellaceae bacterium]
MRKGGKKIGFLGVSVDRDKIIWPEDTLREYKYTPISAVPTVIKQMKLFFDLNRIILGELLTGNISWHILGDPIATFAASGKALFYEFFRHA